MGRIALPYDPDRQNFSLSALAVPPRHRGAEHHQPFVPIEMIVDTGSNITMVNPRTAELLGVDIGSLPTIRTAGIGGFVATPCTPGLDLFLAGDDIARVRIGKVGVFQRLRERTPRAGRRNVARGSQIHPGYNLFGIDALAAIPGRLELDMTRLDGLIRW